MVNYNIAFVGMGSIGKRHLGNVCDLIALKGGNCTIDLYRSSMVRKLSNELLEKVQNQYLCD